MDIRDDRVALSAGDVANHLGCHHLTQLELAAARGQRKRPHTEDPRLEALRERGHRHETGYLEHLQALGVEFAWADAGEGQSATERVQELMRQGAPAIAQAAIAHGRWHGRADLLLRVAQSSELGWWAYEPVETKLARQTRGETILQLCLYANLLAGYQGVTPQRMHVVVPDADWEPETFQVAEYIAYYRLVRSRLEQAVAVPQSTYPEPVPRCDSCPWWQSCEAQWRGDDHLSLVAGISRVHRRELKEHGVETLADLARLDSPVPFTPQRGSAETYERLHEQARVQAEQRAAGEPIYELLPIVEGQGLTRLPPPSPGDVFFDIEGDPFAGSRGLEYLFGWVASDEDGTWHYTAHWALDAAEEKVVFERFMDAMAARWEATPDCHIYHFGAYEPATLKRLVGRHATREDLLDRMLRAGLFVDLHTATRQAVRAGVERYSLKDLEPFHGFAREVPLSEANAALQEVEVTLEIGDTAELTSQACTTVARYNAEDCSSTRALRDWLEQLRDEHEHSGVAVARPEPGDPDPSEELEEKRNQVAELMEALSAGVAVDPSERGREGHARWLLGQLLDWERREDKVAFWEYFRLRDAEIEELFGDRQGIAYLEFDEAVGGTERAPIHRYHFPPQEVGFDTGDLHGGNGQKIGSVAAVDSAQCYVDIKKTQNAADVHPEAVFQFSKVPSDVLANAVFELGEWVRDHGVDAPGPYRSARDLVLAYAPRGPKLSNGGLRGPNEPQLSAAQRIVRELDGGVLAVQGPPGTGKTFTGAHLIQTLVQDGKKVGITANSHRVIQNLLEEVVERSRTDGSVISVIQKVAKPDDDAASEIRQVTKNEHVRDALVADSAKVAAGTAWLWARSDMRDSVDVLIIDEAGQIALARALAVALAAHNVVLLGDPRQLEQPIQASHPEGTDVAALDHLIGDHRTIPPDQGLFLDTTYRLPPTVCRFTSEFFYEGRLQLGPGAEKRELQAGPLTGEGLWLRPVEHTGNQVSSPEEVSAIKDLVECLFARDAWWVDSEGERHPFTRSDILVVAPYNSQVAAIAHELPEIAVGTVDKFQGRQAPLVIYSMASSTPEDAPRGMGFLYSDNRTNVATSRAQCGVVLVCSPDLLTPECRSPEQIRLANAFCGFAERSAPI